MKCHSCGAQFDDDLKVCPYCGTMNSKGSFKAYRKKLSTIKDNVDKLDEDAYTSLQDLIIKSIIKAIFVVAFCVGLGILIGKLIPVNIIDKKYESKTVERLNWYDAHYKELEVAYQNKDLDKLQELFSDENATSYYWKHYEVYTMWQCENQLIKEIERYQREADFKISTYVIGDALEILHSERYAKEFLSLADDDEIQELNESRQNLKALLMSIGIDESESHLLYIEALNGYYLDHQVLEDRLQEVLG